MNVENDKFTVTSTQGTVLIVRTRSAGVQLRRGHMILDHSAVVDVHVRNDGSDS